MYTDSLLVVAVFLAIAAQLVRVFRRRCVICVNGCLHVLLCSDLVGSFRCLTRHSRSVVVLCSNRFAFLLLALSAVALT